MERVERLETCERPRARARAAASRKTCASISSVACATRAPAALSRTAPWSCGREVVLLSTWAAALGPEVVPAAVLVVEETTKPNHACSSTRTLAQKAARALSHTAWRSYVGSPPQPPRRLRRRRQRLHRAGRPEVLRRIAVSLARAAIRGTFAGSLWRESARREQHALSHTDRRSPRLQHLARPTRCSSANSTRLADATRARLAPLRTASLT
mmetsp:Transcript_44946/g.120266  ORF Transcript_44946/g.120266 Transcript_44946/m.120266 type:complete len:212 (+) Transcript_44946:848-1483(+)